MAKSQKPIVIDGKGHMVGRLAAVICKKALEGTPVTVVRCEELIISGRFYRNRMKFMSFLRKHSNTNPTKHSHIHYRSPALMFKRMCRGMLPHKTRHGQIAYDSIKTFEGCPPPYTLKKKLCVPKACKHLCIQPTMPVTRLGDLSASVGWKFGPVVQKLEAVRKERLAKLHENKAAELKDLEAKKQEIIAKAPAHVKEALALLE